MKSFPTPPRELINQKEFVTIDGVPFLRDAAKVFRRKQTPEEQTLILRTLQRIKLEALMHPAEDAADVLTIQEVRFGRAVVRYSQHQASVCVLCFEVLTTLPKERGLHILSTSQVRIRDGTHGPVRSWLRRRHRTLLTKLLTIHTATAFSNLDPKGQTKWLELSQSSNPSRGTISSLVKRKHFQSGRQTVSIAHLQAGTTGSFSTRALSTIFGTQGLGHVSSPSAMAAAETTMVLLKLLAAEALAQRPVKARSGTASSSLRDFEEQLRRTDKQPAIPAAADMRQAR